MPLEISDNAQALLGSELVKQAITLEIDGIPQIFTTNQFETAATYGSGLSYGSPGLLYGATIEDANNKSLINLEGTSYNISQQLRIDRSDISSVQKLAINIVDEAEFCTFNFAPGQVVDDILGRDAIIRIHFLDGIYPQDAVVLLNGKIDEVEFSAGSCRVQVANAIDLARTTAFEQRDRELTADSPITFGFYQLSTGDDIAFRRLLVDGVTFDETIETYIRVGDEINLVTNILGDTVQVSTSGGVRVAFFGTVPADHTTGDSAEIIYRLQDNAINLALKLLLSNEDLSNYASGISASSIVITPSGLVTNAIYFQDQFLETDLGIAPGDYTTITGAGVNNYTNAIIQSISQDSSGTTIVLTNADVNGGLVNLIPDAATGAQLEFKSQYNVLPIKSLISPKHVDVARFQDVLDRFSSSIFDYDFMIRESINNLRDFLSEQVYRPSGVYNLPRKGRISIGFNTPPLNTTTTPILSEDNVKNPQNIKIKRTTNKNFFNAISYDYEENRLESNDFLKRTFTISTDSINRISTRNNILDIQAQGVRDSLDTTQKIDRQIARYLQRFQFAAESLSLDVLYKVGFGVEPGDSVIVNGTNLYITDTRTGQRNWASRVFEVVNKRMNVKNGSVTLELLDTSFASNVRFGVISQSSFIDSGATTELIPLKRSFTTTASENESSKYTDYIGQTFKVRSRDYTFNEECTLVAILGSTLQITALSAPPLEDYIIEAPDYGNDASPLIKSLWKGVHTFLTPQVEVVSGVDNFSFEVNPADTALFSLNQPIEVHSDDYSITSNTSDSQATVTNIDGGTNIITVNRDLGFTPSAGQKVDFIGFATDGGNPYALT